MDAIVISPFIDRETGRRVFPGGSLPPGISESRLRRLEKAGCVRIEKAPSGPDPEPAPDPAPDKPGRTSTRKRKTAAQRSAGAAELFPGSEDPEPPAGTAPLAGTDSGGDGAGAVADGQGCEDGDEALPGDSGR